MNELNPLIQRYGEWLRHNKGRSSATVEKYSDYLVKLSAFLADRGTGLLAASREQLDQFTGIYAFEELRLAPRGRRPLVAAVRTFYTWLHQARAVEVNPAQYVEYPKSGRSLPKAASLQTAEKLLMACDLETFVGVRDAAIFAVLIGCGLRISGLCKLNEESLHWYRDENRRQRLVIRALEKGDKERLVPAPMETQFLLQAYLGHPELEGIDRTLPDGNQVLFVSVNNRSVPAHLYIGEERRIAPRSVFDRIRHYGEQCSLPDSELRPHALRHLFGTELAEGDEDLLVRQDLLGHESADTTKIYTQLAMRKKRTAVDRSSPITKIRTPVSDLVRNITGGS